MPVRVLTVDDHAPFRNVARDLVALTPGFAAVGEAESGEEALLLTRTVAPDLVLLDLRMSGMDGLETARRLSAECPQAGVVPLSGDGNPPGAGPAPSGGAGRGAPQQRPSPRTL